MKIGILTYHRSHNYGAYLQAYALCQSLRRVFEGSQVEIIDYDTKASHKEYLVRIIKAGRIPGIPYYIREYRMFVEAQKRLPLSECHLLSDDCDEFSACFKGKYDLIVVGSDQVWVTHGMRGFPNAFWLPGDLGAKKIAYAASSRSELTRLPLDKQAVLNACVNEFIYVGVRDESTRYEIQKFLRDGKRAKINPDPVFAWDFGALRPKGEALLRSRFGLKAGEKPVGVMLTKKENAFAVIQRIREKGCVPIALYKRQMGARNAVLDPFEWACVVSALHGLVSSFFHGICFAVKYDVPFLAFEERRTSLERSKMYDLLRRIEQEALYCRETDDFGKKIDAMLEQTVDFSKPREELRQLFLQAMKEVRQVLQEGTGAC